MLGILKRPLLTEKISKLNNYRQYAFEVDATSNKIQIKEAIETLFNVKVHSVRTATKKPKYRIRITKKGVLRGSTNLIKKAYITLEPNYTIDISSGEGSIES